MIGMAYFHSDNSDLIKVRKNRNTFSFSAEKRYRSKKIIKEAATTLNRLYTNIGGKIILPTILRLKTGSSIHYGATLPMALTNSIHNVDTLGRPHKYENVHIIDASILSTVPGTPTTWVTIANALRIVSNV